MIVAVAGLVLAACGPDPAGTGPGGGPGAGEDRPGGTITLARASWDTGWFQAEVNALLLEELGYAVSDPAERTRDAAQFYPAVARGDIDLWVNGWFPLHERFLDRQLVTGQRVSQPIEVVGTQVTAGALQGFLVDRASAEQWGITSMADLADPEIAGVFDTDGDGRADLVGCNEGWGCHLAIGEHIATQPWGANVVQVSGRYASLMADVRARVEAGEPVLFYTWTPNWTVAVLEPGVDVVWLEADPLPEVTAADTVVQDLAGCATGADRCQLGWLVNDIRAVANSRFLDGNPPVRRLLEVVELPLADIAAQNARMIATGDYGPSDLHADARAWIADNRDLVDEWLATARGQ